MGAEKDRVEEGSREWVEKQAQPELYNLKWFEIISLNGKYRGIFIQMKYNAMWCAMSN